MSGCSVSCPNRSVNTSRAIFSARLWHYCRMGTNSTTSVHALFLHRKNADVINGNCRSGNLPLSLLEIVIRPAPLSQDSLSTAKPILHVVYFHGGFL